MTMATAGDLADSERVLILAPYGRDAALLAATLEEAGMSTSVCGDLDGLADGLQQGAGAAILADEVLPQDGMLGPLGTWLDDQPPWSDLPFVVLARPTLAAAAAALGNVTYLERPFHPGTIRGAVGAALRARRRQYEARDHLLEIQRGAEALRRSKERFRLMVESATEYAIFATDLDGRITAWNAGARRILGYEEDEVAGAHVRLVFTPEDRAAGAPEAEMRRALADGRAEDERWHLRKDGSRFWASGLHMPLRDAAGAVLGFLKILRDRTREREAEERLRESEARFRQVAGTIDDVFWISEPAPPRLVYLSPAFERVWGRPPDALLREQPAWLDTVHPEDRARVAEAFRRAPAEGHYDAEYRILLLDGTVRWIHDRGRAVAEADGGPPRRFAGIATDVTVRHQAEEGRRLLVAELNHRVKNTLASVQSLAAQTQRSSPGPEFGAAFRGRLIALARAHDLLTRESWEGATLADVAQAALEPWLATAGRVESTGPGVRLAPHQALPLSMALHELATNAAKYGALSVPGGRVFVRWRLDGAEIVLDWTEAGGPPVHTPTRRGFGSRLLARPLATELHGGVELHFERDGLRCNIRFPPVGKFSAVPRGRDLVEDGLRRSG